MAMRDTQPDLAEKAQVEEQIDTQFKLLKAQERVDRVTLFTSELATDTIQELHSQNQQLKADARKLNMVQARLSEADKLIKNMEGSMFSPGTRKQTKAPELSAGDEEFRLRVKLDSDIFRHKRKLRLTRIGILHISGDTVTEAKSFTTLMCIQVLKKAQLVLHFRNRIRKSSEPEAACRPGGVIFGGLVGSVADRIRE